MIKSLGIFRKIPKNKNNENHQQTETVIDLLQIILKISLWLIGILAILSNLGVNITSVIASLGIGGLAIALALQNILTDLFSSFSILMDKPLL